MVLGTIWKVTKSKPNDETANLLTSWEPIRTMTSERLNKVQKEIGLKFSDEMLCGNSESYDKCMGSDWINIDTQIVTDENFDQFCFEFSKGDFTHWCNGDLVPLSDEDHYSDNLVKEYLHNQKRPVRLRVIRRNCCCAPNWLFTEKSWEEDLKDWCDKGKYPYKVYRDYSGNKFFEG